MVVKSSYSAPEQLCHKVGPHTNPAADISLRCEVDNESSSYVNAC